jgi:hypothetical protein
MQAKSRTNACTVAGSGWRAVVWALCMHLVGPFTAFATQRISAYTNACTVAGGLLCLDARCVAKAVKGPTKCMHRAHLKEKKLK